MVQKVEMQEYHVRKGDTISYHCSYYTVPSGTYRNAGSVVLVEEVEDRLHIYSKDTGKTYVAGGLIYEAVKNGKKAYMLTMEELITTIKMKSIAPTAMGNYNRIAKADLVAIDDIMLFPVNKEDAAGFFNLINTMHEQTSIIITTNKSPTEWAQTLDDEVLASSLLDRLLYRCEVINLKGTSYRIENRKTIFNNKTSKKQEK